RRATLARTAEGGPSPHVSRVSNRRRAALARTAEGGRPHVSRVSNSRRAALARTAEGGRPHVSQGFEQEASYARPDGRGRPSLDEQKPRTGVSAPDGSLH